MASKDQIVLVNRGWVASPDDSTVKPIIDVKSDEIELAAEIHVPSIKPLQNTRTIEEPTWPLVIRQINLQQWQSFFDKPLFPYIVRLDENNPNVLQRHWIRPLIDPGKNTSYAFQWFAMASVLAIVVIFLSTGLRESFFNRGIQSLNIEAPPLLSCL